MAEWESRRASISENGERVVFESDASNLISDDNNSHTDVFLYDTKDSGITLLSKSIKGNLPNDASDQAKISGDGKFVTFRSKATNIIEGKGISYVSVISGGVGYFGTPTITVSDFGGSGQNAEIRFLKMELMNMPNNATRSVYHF